MSASRLASAAAPRRAVLPPRGRPSTAALAIGVILAVALATRLIAIAATPHYAPINDSADYDRYAVSLVEHGRFPASQLVPGPTAFRPPLFPLALSAAYEISGASRASSRWEAGRLLEAVLGTITVALIMLIARRVWGVGAALLSGAIAAVYPPLILVGSSLMSESLYIPLGLAAVLAALKLREGGRPWRWAVLTGILVALAAMTRATMLALLVPAMLLAWYQHPRLSRRSVIAPGLVLGATILTLVPWTVRNLAVLHTFVPISTETGYALIGTYDAHAQSRTDYPALYQPPVYDAARIGAAARGRNEAQLSDRLTGWALDYIKAHPSSLLKTSLWAGIRLLDLSGPGFERWIEPTWGYDAGLAAWSVYAFWLVGALAVLGAVTSAARRAPRALWLCPLAVLAPTILVIGATRYRSPADPFIVMLASLGLLAAARRIRPPVPSPPA